MKFLFLLIIAKFSFGEITPIRSAHMLANPVEETAVHLNNARILAADYNLIRKDFPVTRLLSETEIDQWLLKNAALVSKAQSNQTIVNTFIPFDNEVTMPVYRPDDYNRALVTTVTGGGLIDIKGAGSRNPIQADHKNGLATTGEAIREYLYEKLVNMVLKDAQSDVSTVGCYAVLDSGFSVVHEDGTKSPAGLILRQAHQRSTATSYSGFSDEDTVKVEKILRKYGITSAGAHYGENSFDLMNIQGTRDAKGIVDFGGFLVLEKFEHKAVNFDHEQTILLDPSHKDFVQPNFKKRIPLDLWGQTSGKIDPKADNPWIWSHELTDALANGRADRNSVETHLKNFLEPVQKILEQSKTCNDLFN